MPKIFILCESCGQPILPYEARRGESHKECFDLSHTCQNCDTEIHPGEGVVTDDGEGYHRRCLTFSPTSCCEHCHKSIPVSELREVDGKKYHADCHRKNFFCAECEKAVIPEERQFDRNGVSYHKNCLLEKETLQNNLRQIEEAGAKLSKMFPKCQEEIVAAAAACSERAMLISFERAIKKYGYIPVSSLFSEKD